MVRNCLFRCEKKKKKFSPNHSKFLVCLDKFSLLASLFAISWPLIFAQFIDRDGTVKASAANLTAFNTPYAYYDFERDPRQWYANAQAYNYPSSLSPFSGGIEAIGVGLLIAIGIGAIGLPLIILLYSMFLGNSNAGFNFVPPATTTTVQGRKRRDLEEKMFNKANPNLRGKLFDVYKQFTSAQDKFEYVKNLLQL